MSNMNDGEDCVFSGFILCLLVGVGYIVSMDSVHAATLMRSLEAARSYDTEYSAARHAYNASGEARWQGIAGLLPQAQFESNVSKHDQPKASYGAAVKRHSYSVSVAQPLFDLSKVADYQRGVVIAQAADIEFGLAEQKLIMRVADAYLEVLFQREVMRVATAQVSVFTHQLEAANLAMTLGDSTRLEVSEVQVSYDQATARKIATLNNLELANTAYERVTGLQSTDIGVALNSFYPLVLLPVLEEVMERVQQNNLDIKLAEYRLAKADTDVLGARAAHLPVVNVQASYGGNWSRGENENELDSIFGTTSKTRNTMIGATLTVPLFGGGRQLSQSRQAYSQRDEASDLVVDVRRKAQQDARAAYMGVTNGYELLQAQQRAVLSAVEKVKSTQFAKRMGMRTTADELSAQQNYYEAIRDSAEYRLKYLKSSLELAAVMGALNEVVLTRLDRASQG